MLSKNKLGKTQARAKGVMMNSKEYKKLANGLLDFVCENFNLVEVCSWLIEWGYSYDQVLELGFEQDTIDQAQKEIDKGLIQ